MPKISLDLTGKWEFKEYPASARRMRDLDSADWLKTNVPSSIFTSLIAADKIKQNAIDARPEDFSWVSEKPWIYKKTFNTSTDLLDCDRIELVFDGLDTITSVWLNDKLIGRTNNMFIPFRFDVKSLLKLKNNTLLVKFDPAIEYAKRLMSRYTTFSESDFIYPYRVYIRKAQYQFGWDWCPPLPGCGIWRDVRLEGIRKARLADLHIRTIDCNSRYADIKIAVKLDTKAIEKFPCKLTLSSSEQITEHSLAFNPGEDSHSTVIRIENPLLWWPAGYGRQNLYKLGISLLDSNEVIDQMQRTFGIRTTKISRSPDECGEKFQFEINGQPIFAKGANWIPASIFAGSVQDDNYERLLSAAAEANMNMLRVWGGGYYEADIFYELCDQLGIMIWQDFMFACAYYPDRKWFMEEVKREASSVIKQLRNHPCLVLWCGNNEIDEMHFNGKMGKGKKFYGKAIYHRLLPQLTAELDPDTDYIPTTPLDPKNNFKSDKTLTTHSWGVWSGYQPISQYLSQDIPRFVTEFGMQSLPGTETIKNRCSADKPQIGSFEIEKHNYQVNGNTRLYQYIGELFGTAENLEQFIYLSQITQARGIKTYVEHLRAHNFRNSGVLFWQFNDCCPAISWSAIDVAYEPKALYYYAKRFFSKLLVTVASEPKAVLLGPPSAITPFKAVVINDSEEPITATLNCRLIDLFGHLLDEVTLPLTMAPFSTLTSKLPKSMISPPHPDQSALHLLINKHDKKITENLFFYLPDKYINWPKTEINKHVSQTSNNQWKLRLKSNAIVRDVQISTTSATQFSDNFIDLLPTDECKLTIGCRKSVQTPPVFKLRSFKCVFQTD